MGCCRAYLDAEVVSDRITEKAFAEALTMANDSLLVRADAEKRRH